MSAILSRLNEVDKKLNDILFDDQDDRTEDEKKLQNFIKKK